MHEQLKETNSYGIRVVANRGPILEQAQVAFRKGSRNARKGINELLQEGTKTETKSSKIP